MPGDMTSGMAVPVKTEARPEEDNPDPASGPDSVTAAANADAAREPDTEPTLPPLTSQEFRVYNRLAEKMEYFVFTPFLPTTSPYPSSQK